MHQGSIQHPCLRDMDLTLQGLLHSESIYQKGCQLEYLWPNIKTSSRSKVKCHKTLTTSSLGSPQHIFQHCYIFFGVWISVFFIFLCIIHTYTTAQKVTYKLCTIVYKCLHQSFPEYHQELCVPVTNIASLRHLRSAAHGNLRVLATRTVTYGPRSFAMCPNLWNCLPTTLLTLNTNADTVLLSPENSAVLFTLWKHFATAKAVRARNINTLCIHTYKAISVSHGTVGTQVFTCTDLCQQTRFTFTDSNITQYHTGLFQW